MLKRIACMLVFAVIVASFGFMQAAAGQDCTPEFALYSAESTEGTPAAFVIIRIAVKNTGSCAGTATVSAELPQDWLASPPFTTDEIQPGSADTTHFIKVIIPSGAITSVVNFTAPGANGSSTNIIIAGSPQETEETVQEPPAQQNQTPNLIIDTTPVPIAPAAQPSQNAEPQAEQSAAPSAGLLTANPSAQIAVFAVLLFGAGYMAARIKSEGFRYKFRRK